MEDLRVLASDTRLLKQTDEDELCRIFLTLEPSARCCRFGQAASDAYLVKHAKNSLANADWIVGIFIAERLRGLALLWQIIHAASLRRSIFDSAGNVEVVVEQ